ncbi:MAG: septation protein SpoVG family protein [Planctomycetes bacterium]|nr:septation protein SpoVG family protein [Planctomycetota bacterium]
MSVSKSDSLSRPIIVSGVQFHSADAEQAATGLLGFVSATLNGKLRIDGLALRRSLEGKVILSWPAKRDAAGQQHHFVRPLDSAARQEIERQILGALPIGRGLAS